MRRVHSSCRIIRSCIAGGNQTVSSRPTSPWVSHVYKLNSAHHVPSVQGSRTSCLSCRPRSGHCLKLGIARPQRRRARLCPRSWRDLRRTRQAQSLPSTKPRLPLPTRPPNPTSPHPLPHPYHSHQAKRTRSTTTIHPARSTRV